MLPQPYSTVSFYLGYVPIPEILGKLRLSSQLLCCILLTERPCVRCSEPTGGELLLFWYHAALHSQRCYQKTLFGMLTNL